MILDLESLQQAVRGGATFSYRLFYGHTPRADGRISDAVFSQFYPCDFVIFGVRYRYAEQWMMASKARLFGDGEALTEILAADGPLSCKQIGRRVRGFDEARWRGHRFDLVTAGNVAKFGQSEPLRAHLLDTGSEILVEAAPRDRIWGIGMGASNPAARDPQRWQGQNLLGFALVRARAILRGQAEPPQLPACLVQ